MKNSSFFSPVFILFLLVSQINPGIAQQRKVIQKKYPNGNPSLAIMLNAKGEKVKEISYFENGQIDYEGSFKDGVEHGIWTYYYKNGTKMYVETYKSGLEEGKHYEYNADGQLNKIEVYKSGQLIETIENPE